MLANYKKKIKILIIIDSMGGVGQEGIMEVMNGFIVWRFVPCNLSLVP